MGSEVKQRFDGKGSEFGLVHRKLPGDCAMFDIDHIEATATIRLVASREDYAFIEYKTDFKSYEVRFKALFEIKHMITEHVGNVIKNRTLGVSTFAQINMCKVLKCRYFIVVATNGNQPFTFVEILVDDYIPCEPYKDEHDKTVIGKNKYINHGRLEYTESNKSEAINKFWKEKIHLL